MSFAITTHQQDSIRIPNLWVAVALSIVLHMLLLVGLPSLPLDILAPGDDDKLGKTPGSLAVRLTMPPKPQAQRSEPQPPPQPILTRPAKPVPQPAPKAPPAPAKAPVLTATGPKPGFVIPPPSPAPPGPAPKAAPPANDLSALIESRRRAREAEEKALGRPAESRPQETEQERNSRLAAANLGLNRATGMGANRNQGGGIFQIVSISEQNATVAFYGWNKTVERKILQTIDVNRGNEPSIEMAVVHRMMELIRTQTTGNFTWESLRLGRDVELSARGTDAKALERFLMDEFFYDSRLRPGR